MDIYSLEEQFKRARKDISFRQQFLNQIDLEEMSKFVRRVKYIPIQESERGNIILMETYVKLLPFLKLDIGVYPASFNLPTIGYFLNVLIDHEGQHVRDLYSKPFLVNAQRIEQNAYWNQMMQAERRGLDDDWQRKVAFEYSYLYG